jgi:glycolate oxidase
MQYNIKDIEEIVGKDNVSTKEVDKIVYSFDASELEGSARAVVWVENVEQIIKIVNLANRKRIPLVVRGGGTGLTGSTIPLNSIVVDLSRLNHIVEINQKKKYVVVEPGVILDDLNCDIQKYGLTFPILPASHRVATIGGIIATNAAGIRAVKYGKVREWILELEVVTGSGKVEKIDGNKIDDFCGTEGILGIIIKAKLKLVEPIEETSLSLFKFDDLGQLLKKMLEIKNKVISLEFIDKLTADIEGLEKTNYLIAEFEGDQGEIKDKNEIMKIWEMRDGAYPALAANGFPITGDPIIPLDKLSLFLSKLEEMKIPCVAHIGLGIVHPCFKQGDFEKRDEIIKFALKLGGKASGEHGIGLIKKEFLDKKFVENLRKLNKKYDPNDILNKGKVI